jgi:hypothetical protein
MCVAMVRKTADNSTTFYSPKMLKNSQFLAKRRIISQIPGVWVIFPKWWKKSPGNIYRFEAFVSATRSKH